MSPNSRDCSHTEGDFFQGKDFTSYDSPGITIFKVGLVIVDGDNDAVDAVGVENLANQLSSSSVA